MHNLIITLPHIAEAYSNWGNACFSKENYTRARWTEALGLIPTMQTRKITLKSCGRKAIEHSFPYLPRAPFSGFSGGARLKEARAITPPMNRPYRNRQPVDPCVMHAQKSLSAWLK
jgi:hypothetical protein